MHEEEIAEKAIPDKWQEMRGQLVERLRERSRFADFVQKNDSKICKKFKGARERDDALDICTELEIAWRLMGNIEYSLLYEPCSGKGCDFVVEHHAGNFNVEVKRIREVNAMKQYDKFLNRVISAVRSIPSNLGISLDCNSLELSSDFPESLLEHSNKVVSECIAIVKFCKARFRYTESQCFQLRSCPELNLEITHLANRSPDSVTAYFGGTQPVFYKQNDYLKLSNLLVTHLDQFRDGVPNVLVIRSNSSTHEAQELPLALNEINKLVNDPINSIPFFAKHNFSGSHDFREKFSRLSAALFINGERTILHFHPSHLIWKNPLAEQPLDSSALKYLAQM